MNLFDNMHGLKGCIRCLTFKNVLLAHFLLAFSVAGSVSAEALPTSYLNGIEQQSRKVAGCVLQRVDNEPVIGANIVVTGTTIGTITDVEGRFSLDNLPANARTLTVSFVGMTSQTLPIKSEMMILLEDDSETLDEVMVVAYGTAKKSTFTGSASLLKSEKIEARPVTSATSALLGSTPGVQVASASGQPGSDSDIYIRGLGSISATNTPLIILNGMPYDQSISSINPNDIESMSVLKDASSAALYGARGGNGVILITTKTGSKDRMSVNVKINQGFTNRQSQDYERLGVNDYLKVYWESARNQLISGGASPEQAGMAAAQNLISGTLGFNPFNVPDDQVVDANGVLNPNATFMWADDTDWEDAIQRTGSRTDIGVSVSGGNNKSDYYLSAGYLTEGGYIIGSKFDRYTLNTNVNSQITSFLKIGGTLSGNISKAEGQQSQASGNNNNPFRFTRYIGPIYPIHVHDPRTKEYVLDANGNKVYDFGQAYTIEEGVEAPSRAYIFGNNPAIELQNISNGCKRNQLNAKLYAEIRFLNDFKFTVNGAVGTSSRLGHSASIYYPEKTEVGSSTKTVSFETTWTFNQLLSYTKNFGNHHVDVLLGHESYDYEYNYLKGSMQNQTIHNGNFEFSNYSVPDEQDSYTNTYKTEGFLARANYDYNSRYFLSASVRRDGSSRFYKDSRWGTFFSVGAGWRIDEERFMEDLDFIDLLKLRVAYGEVGNDAIGSYYAWQAAYEQAMNGLEAGYIQQRVVRNKDLQWEVSRNGDVALEFELFKSRLSGSVEYFDRRSSNLLFSIPQAPDTGTTSAYKNAGTMYNRGVEVDLNGRIIQTKDWTWSVGINATWLKNRITSLPVEPYNSGVHRVEEGHSRYEFYLRQWAGVDPATGNSIYVPDPELTVESVDLVEVDGKTYTTNVNEAIYDWAGESTPKVSGGLNTNVSWKNLSLSLLFNFQLGGKMYDVGYSDLMTQPSGSASLTSNKHVDILNRWQKPGDVTNVPRIEDFADTNMNAGTSTRWLISSNMLELASATLSYDLPKQWLEKVSMQGLRVYASGENLFLLTKRKGIFPRSNIFSGYSGNADVYLPARVFTFGLNLTF